FNCIAILMNSPCRLAVWVCQPPGKSGSGVIAGVIAGAIKGDPMPRLTRVLFSLLTSLALLLPFSAKAAENPRVEIKTSMGDIVLELYPEQAPKTVENFLNYVKSGHYDGTIFHRVINGFMIQGGGFDSSMKQKTAKATVENEAKNGLKNEPYTVAMARTAAPHSASAQFFINVNNNAALN